jgi:hypothetical protein
LFSSARKKSLSFAYVPFAVWAGLGGAFFLLQKFVWILIPHNPKAPVVAPCHPQGNITQANQKNREKNEEILLYEK